jgi:hypothetical protein
MTDQTRKFLRWAPRILGVAVAALLAIFALDVFDEGRTPAETAVALVAHLVPSLIVMAVVVLAWHRELAGGLLFVALGALYIGLAWGRFPFITYLLISGPLVVAGALFLTNWTTMGRRSG